MERRVGTEITSTFGTEQARRLPARKKRLTVERFMSVEARSRNQEDIHHDVLSDMELALIYAFAHIYDRSGKLVPEHNGQGFSGNGLWLGSGGSIGEASVIGM